ncbi:NfeD family protein [Lyngbya sp. CCY1209]|uniref:NfeD family protein n=1 Tax=Lyngbya sp. CCY1209 TaxID=2886103 RepID=UPI002D20ACFB|nr:NfeD family protein [Lyngbya sp. CCY1209]MEB3883939.1 NfeD family protein [Lyngbya sp. CCY1209]
MFVNPTLFWLLAGVLLCLMELFLPTAFIEFMMGLSALAVAGISLLVPNVGVQVVLWMILSLVFALGVRRLLPSRRVSVLEAATEAESLTEILPGQTGRVLCEGVSWRARCEGEFAIAPQQRVLVVSREGNTLIVVPEKLIHS